MTWNDEKTLVDTAQPETQSVSAATYGIYEFEGEGGFFRLREEWQQLWSLSDDSTETQTWAWQYLYWKHLAPKTRPLIIVARDSRNCCVALGCFFISRDPSSWLSKATFLGDKRPDYNMILALPGIPSVVGLKILDRFVSKFRRHASFVELSNVPQKSYTGSLIPKFLDETRGWHSENLCWETQTYAVPLPNTVDEYLQLLGPRSRRDFRYDRRQLSTQFRVDFRAYSSVDNLEEALGAIEAVDKSRWGSNSRYHLHGHRSFERAVAQAFCEMGVYRSYVLYLDDKPSAFVTGAVVRNLYKVSSIGFDRSVPAKWSIGKVTNFYAIENCIENNYAEFDLTRGGEQYKKWLGATPSTNLHIRQYRTPLDQRINDGCEKFIQFLRGQEWLRGIYRELLRR